MFFSKAQVLSGQVDPEKMVSFLEKDGYGLHQMIWALFPHQSDAHRDFIYRRDDKQGWPCFYVVSHRRPENISGLFAVDAKKYHPKLKEGERLTFSLRVNPVVTKKNGNGKRSRHDVVMDAKQKFKKEEACRSRTPGIKIDMPELIRKTGLKWLASRSNACGFTFHPEQVTVEGYFQHRMAKLGKSKSISFSTLDFDGLLTVKDVPNFTRMLFTGMGPAKAFGCGLMLVRRI
jgi:CRISPR system Cascade subunit CasE